MKTVQKQLFNFQNSYLKLPSKFYSGIELQPTKNPKLLLFNSELAERLGISKDKAEMTQILSGNKITNKSMPIAQAYAGHQFGYFTMLGDGRAVLLGEHITPSGFRYDIQLKGGGRTPYSRNGDGKAALRPMVKEYLISESLNCLGIPTSRSLALIGTDEKVYRERVNDRAILTRIMKSHIRVGTFEYAAYFGEPSDLKALLEYTLERLYPELFENENHALALLRKVMELQIDLVVNWMRIGFIHGVMNTDNTSISGESFDYGPCAFLSEYNPGAIFSSIDENGRYAYKNQPGILKWNLARLAETLLSLVDKDEEKAVEKVMEVLNEYDELFNAKYMKMMFSKLGIAESEETDLELLKELLRIMKTERLNFTHTFTRLRIPEIFEEEIKSSAEFESWKKNWQNRITKQEGGAEAAFSLMQKYNPVLIPFNYQTERILDDAEAYDFGKLKKFLELIKSAYDFKPEMKEFLNSPESFDAGFQTFCGT